MGFSKGLFGDHFDLYELKEVDFATSIFPQTLLLKPALPPEVLGSENGTAILSGTEATRLGIILASSLLLISTSNCHQTLLVVASKYT